MMTSASLIAAAQAVDTLYMLPPRDGLATAALIADVVLTTTFVLIAAALALMILQLRGMQRTVARLAGRTERQLEPVLDRARHIAANVDFISAAVRTDVERVSDSVRSLSDRLQSASDRMERRVQEFNALMEVVQSEAEDIFIGSAATVRGVRAGARALRDGGSGEPMLDEDDVELEDEAGLPPRTLGPAALETERAPEAAPGGVQVTSSGERGTARVTGGGEPGGDDRAAGRAGD